MDRLDRFESTFSRFLNSNRNVIPNKIDLPRKSPRSLKVEIYVDEMAFLEEEIHNQLIRTFFTEIENIVSLVEQGHYELTFNNTSMSIEAIEHRLSTLPFKASIQHMQLIE